MPEKNEKTTASAKSVFATLREIDMSSKHKEKNKLSYLPWASAWATVKSIYPDATFKVLRDYNDNLYFTDGKTCRVETEVTIEGQTQWETLAVMDHRNASIPLDNITSTAVDKSIKRCLTKNLALFGLDLNLWEGEELSDEAKVIVEEKEKIAKEALDEKKKEVKEKGTALIKLGVSPEKMYEIVSKHNAGNKNPGSIKSIEVCEAILKEFTTAEADFNRTNLKGEKK